MLSESGAENRDTIWDDNRTRDDNRHVAIKIDSMNWKTFILGGAIACVAALQPVVDIFSPSTTRSVVLVGGVCAIVGGLGLRRRFRRYIDRKVQGIIDQYK